MIDSQDVLSVADGSSQIRRFDTDGNELSPWTVSFLDTVGVRTLYLTSEDGLAVGGASASKGFAARLDAVGQTLWARTVEMTETPYAYGSVVVSVAVDAVDDVIVGGVNSEPYPNAQTSFYAKLDALTGASSGSHSMGAVGSTSYDQSSILAGVAVDASGDVFVSYTYPQLYFTGTAWLYHGNVFKVDGLGLNVLWNVQIDPIDALPGVPGFPTEAHVFPTRLRGLADGSVVVSGETNGHFDPSVQDREPMDYDAFVYELSADGTQFNAHTFHDSGNDSGEGFFITQAGDIYLVGSTEGDVLAGEGEDDVLVAKFEQLGF